MSEMEFLVQGSSPEPYTVIFQRAGTNLTATCTCPAGVVGQYCKHRIRIMAGDATGIVSPNIAAVPEITKWVKGTDVERALKELHIAEQQLEAAQKHVSNCKKRLARSLRD
jgi:hypothetical protein